MHIERSNGWSKLSQLWSIWIGFALAFLMDWAIRHGNGFAFAFASVTGWATCLCLCLWLCLSQRSAKLVDAILMPETRCSLKANRRYLFVNRRGATIVAFKKLIVLELRDLELLPTLFVIRIVQAAKSRR